MRWRFRVNVLQQMGHVGLVARRVNNWIPDFEGLYLPPIMDELCKFDQGMVLLAGVTGSGKSTTIASMLNWINANYRKHILTLEDPIEFIFTEDKCLINQREIGLDVKDFEIGMKHAVREDPDVMLVGEMRDRETFMTAIHAAETGHLVFGTIHASSAASTIGRILDLFPADMHPALRSAIAFNMKGIVAQKLLPSIKPGVSRVPTVEIMTFNPTVRKLILEEQDEKLADAIRIGGPRGHAGFHDEPEGPGGARLDRPGGGVGSGPERRSPEDGAQRHRRFATRDSLMLRLFARARRGDGRLGRRRAMRCWRPMATPVGPRWGMPFMRGTGAYLSPWKILVTWLLFLAWVRTTDWISQDAQIVEAPLGAVEPDRVLQLLRRPAAVVDPALVCRGLRRCCSWPTSRRWPRTSSIATSRCSPPTIRCSRASTLRRWIAQQVERDRHQDGRRRHRPARARAPTSSSRRRAAPTDRDNNVNLLTARQSPGFMPSRELLDDALGQRATHVMLDYTPESVGVRYQIDGVWHDRPPIERAEGDRGSGSLQERWPR